jgi:hypothetical protein
MYVEIGGGGIGGDGGGYYGNCEMETVVKIIGCYYKLITIYKKTDNIFQHMNKI